MSRKAFEAWWEKEGQFCRAGGGDYEKTFAFRAYEAARAAALEEAAEIADSHATCEGIGQCIAAEIRARKDHHDE